jgi:hypothetical protein
LAGTDAAVTEEESFGDAVFLDGFYGVVGAGGLVAAANPAAGDGMDVVVVSIDGSSKNAHADLVGGWAERICNTQQKEEQEQGEPGMRLLQDRIQPFYKLRAGCSAF